MQALTLLLVSALQLLGLIQAHPQLPESFRNNAMQVAVEAIQTVQNALLDGSLASTTVTTQITSSDQTVAPITATTTVPTGPTFGAIPTPTPTPAPVVIPAVKKELQFYSNSCVKNTSWGTVCNIEVR